MRSYHSEIFHFGIEQSFVETQQFHELLELVRSRRSPVILTGPAGTGKTANLYALMAKMLREERTILFVSSIDVRGETDLINIWRDQLEEQKVKPTGSVRVGSSADSSSGSLSEYINALPEPPTILFDSVDELGGDENSAIRLALGEIHRETRANIVLSARRMPPWFSSEFGNFYEINLAPFNLEQIEEFLNKRKATGKSLEYLPVLDRIASGNPLILSLALDLLEAEELTPSDILKLDSSDSSKIMERIVTRDAHKVTGIDGITLEDYQYLLMLLSLKGTVSFSELSLPEATAKSIVERSMIVEADGPLVRFAHISLSDHIRRPLGFSLPPDLRISDLTFGMEEAERDNLLVDSFLPPRGMTDIVQGNVTIVVGDRGSGKSALYSHLVSSQANSSARIVAIRDPRTLIERMGAEGRKLQTSEEFREAWRLAVAVTLAEDEELSGARFHQETAKALRREFSEEPNADVGWPSKIKQVFTGSKVKFTLGPVSLEADPSTRSRSKMRTISVDAFLSEVAQDLAKRSSSVTLAVDRIDEIHKYDRGRQEALVQGLFQAEAEMSQLDTIGLLIFIRSDLFHVYSIEEKNKLVSRRLDLEWRENELLELLVARVFADKALNDLRSKTRASSDALSLAMPVSVERAPFLDWFWSSMRNGNGRISPRQIVLFLILCKKTPQANAEIIDDFPIFSTLILRSAMTSLSELSFEEMIDDFRVAPSFLRNCRAGKVEELEAGDLEELYDDDADRNRDIDHLERLGFLERTIRQDEAGAKSSSFRIPELFTRAWKEGVTN